MVTLATAVNSSATTWALSAALPAGTEYLQADEELVAVITRAIRPSQREGPTLFCEVERGTAGTRASHSQGITLETLADPPLGAGGGGAIAVDNTVDPPADVTTLVVAGQSVVDGTATWLTLVEDVITWLLNGDGSGQLEIVGMNVRLKSIDGADDSYFQVTPTGIQGLLAFDTGEFVVTSRVTGGTGDGGEILVRPDGVYLQSGSSPVVSVSGGEVTSALGFYGANPVLRPEVPASPTEQDIVDALVLLGLVTQAAP